VVAVPTRGPAARRLVCSLSIVSPHFDVRDPLAVDLRLLSGGGDDENQAAGWPEVACHNRLGFLRALMGSVLLVRVDDGLASSTKGPTRHSAAAFVSTSIRQQWTLTMVNVMCESLPRLLKSIRRAGPRQTRNHWLEPSPAPTMPAPQLSTKAVEVTSQDDRGGLKDACLAVHQTAARHHRAVHLVRGDGNCLVGAPHLRSAGTAVDDKQINVTRDDVQVWVNETSPEVWNFPRLLWMVLPLWIPGGCSQPAVLALWQV
jgi:hypothetical protein